MFSLGISELDHSIIQSHSKPLIIFADMHYAVYILYFPSFVIPLGIFPYSTLCSCAKTHVFDMEHDGH